MKATRKGPIEERFMNRFVVDGDTECWNWTGTRTIHGYGVIGGLLYGRRYCPPHKKVLAHRVSWIIHRGEIPEGEGYYGTVVMHQCDNPRCVNPAHLRLGTQAENMADKVAKGRHIAARKREPFTS
jgi:hypothetical protein